MAVSQTARQGLALLGAILLVAACGPTAWEHDSDDWTASRRTERMPAGDLAWATDLARSSLPPAAEPEAFPVLAGPSTEGKQLQASSAAADATRFTRAEVRAATVEVSFRIRWGDPAQGWSGEDCPTERCHWWRFEVWPDGQLVWIGEGGAALLAYSMEGAWHHYRDAALGFAAAVPADWQVTGPDLQRDTLGRSWASVEFVSPVYALGYPPLDQYRFDVAVAEATERTLTETVELSLSTLSPEMRALVKGTCCLDVAGAPAMELLGFPLTRWGNRQLVMLHEGWEYRLTFYPALGISADSESGVAARRILDTFLQTFQFIPVTQTPWQPTPTVTPAPTPTLSAPGPDGEA